MKKLLLAIILIWAVGLSSFAQTATNFTATDCDGNTHTLFTELNAGKVIVLVWVMPCSACIPGAKTASNIVQSYSASNPGKVAFYIADDQGDFSCTGLTGWTTTNGVGSATVFDNAGNTIDQMNYGGRGMPHTVILGGSNHTIYFDGKYADAENITAIQTAINNALGATGINNNNENGGNIKLYPNPASKEITVNYTTKQIGTRSISIYNVLGQQIIHQSKEVGSGIHQEPIDISGLRKGTYFLKLSFIGAPSRSISFLKE